MTYNLFLWETPPRAWGRPARRSFLLNQSRNTPTCVGKTYVSVKAPKSYVKHPHVRGEDYSIMILERAKRETPPRAWGRLFPVAVHVFQRRNTPTCVGKTRKAAQPAVRIQKHPHVRGEDYGLVRQNPCEPETPPRAWGRPHTRPETAGYRGNTPTCVGKTK